LDLAWPEVGLAVEPSGGVAHAGARRTRRDHVRDAWLTVEDWEVMYAVWSDLDAPDRFRVGVETVYLRRAAARSRA
jgi:hypothetical protein